MFNTVTLCWIALALVLFPIQLFITAPYGRHVRAGWGPQISNRLGWSLMEIVSLLLFAALFIIGTAPKHAPAWIFFACWTAHYANRALIFPWRTHTSGKTIPVLIVAWAILFNLVNAGLNGTALGTLYTYPPNWLTDPHFIIGLALFLTGAAINLSSDNTLIALRDGSETDYKIPCGGLFEFISCPNLFGEIVQWSGFALMVSNLAGVSFAIWTAANLIPRALSHHRWYRDHFPDYPPSRKAVVPFVL